PEHHRSADSRDVVKLSMGLVATMAALVLGLLISSGKGSYDRIQTLVPRTDLQRSLQANAAQLIADIGRTRSLLFAQRGASIPMPFLVVLIFWAAALFVSFGLFTTPNSTVVVSLLVCALSVARAIFLILELDQPFQGFIQVSSAPLRETLAHLE